MFAHIVVVGKNGRDGGIFPVSGDVLLGRYNILFLKIHLVCFLNFNCKQKTIFIFRKEDCDIRLNLTSCSRHHAQFIVQKETGMVMKTVCLMIGYFHLRDPLIKCTSNIHRLWFSAGS